MSCWLRKNHLGFLVMRQVHSMLFAIFVSFLIIITKNLTHVKSKNENIKKIVLAVVF